MKFFLLTLGVMLCGVVVPGTVRAQNVAAVVVVVNAANPVSTLTKEQVSDLFLKKVTRWESDKIVMPVDQERNSKTRELFSRAVHRRSISAVASYWQTQIFSGNNVPPATKATDADVLAFVRANPNAIGYVSGATPLGADVKAVTVGGL